MNRRDAIGVLVIGFAVGLLIQPVLSNTPLAPHLSVAVRVAVVIGFVVGALGALWVASLLGRIWRVLYQFAKFCAVGALNTFVDLGVLNLEILLLGTPSGWFYGIFKSVSFLAGATNSFLWNKFWTFNSKTPANPSETIRFYFVATVGYLLNVGLSTFVFAHIAHPASITANFWANIAALTGVLASFLWDFLGYKYLVFKDKR